MPREAVNVAYVKKAHALDGELFVQLETDYPEEIFVRERVFRVSGGGPIGLAGDLTLTRGRPHKGGWILEFEEIADRTLAERYKGRRLTVAREELVELGEGEYFLHDLYGLDVRDEDDDRDLGRVATVHETAGRPLLVVEGEDGQAMVPMVREFVRDVDLEEGVIRIRPPAGLLEL